MKLHLLLNIALPALALVGVAAGVALSSRTYAELAQKPTEAQMHDVSRKIENNELSQERLKQITIDTTRARKELDQSASEFLRIISIAIVFFTGWLAIGCYQFARKAQQGVPGDVAASRRRA